MSSRSSQRSSQSSSQSPRNGTTNAQSISIFQAICDNETIKLTLHNYLQRFAKFLFDYEKAKKPKHTR